MKMKSYFKNTSVGFASILWVFLLFYSCNSSDSKTITSEITSNFKVEKEQVTDTIQLNQLITAHLIIDYNPLFAPQHLK